MKHYAQRQSANSYFSAIEDAMAYACYSAAEKSGYDHQAADLCDDGNLDCNDCPFRHGIEFADHSKK